MTAGGGTSSSAGRGAWEATNTVFRIAKVGLSLASAIMTMTATSKQCMSPDSGGATGGKVSYSDYGSFQYSAIASLVSAVLQGVAIWLEVVGKERWLKTVELIDKVVQALTSTSAALLLSVDDITSCGPPRSRGGAARRQQPRSFDAKLGLASITSLSTVVLGAANDVVMKVMKELPATSSTTSTPPPPPQPIMFHLPSPPPPPPVPPPLRPPSSPPTPSTPPLPSPRSPSPPSSPFLPRLPPPPRKSPARPPTDRQTHITPNKGTSPTPPCDGGCDGGCDDGTDSQRSQFILIIMMLIIALLFYRLCSRCNA